MERFARTKCQEISKAKRCYSTFACKLQYALKGQKLLAQGIALGYYGRKPVAL